MPTTPPRRNSASSGAPRTSTTRTPQGSRGGRQAPSSGRTDAAPNRGPAPRPATRTDLFSGAATLPDGTDTFASLGLAPKLVAELSAQGITTPFPIQAATIADCLDGRDVLGRAKTGSGKTLAFALPLLSILARRTGVHTAGRPRALVLAPTRELAVQIRDVMAPYARVLSLSMTTVFGGVGAGPQITALRNGVDVVIACPGRLLDHLGEGHATLAGIEITVLDEADHMADMGFLPDVRRLLDRTPRNSQRLLFSATLDNGIDTLVRQYLHEPIVRSVESDPDDDGVMIHHVLAVEEPQRVPVLRELAAAPGRTLVFTRTKHGAKKLAKVLTDQGVPAVEMHGNLSQNARLRNLEAFREGRATTMIATDVAARGIHVDDVELVVHFDPPVDHKAYLHRSGRTARAGADGTVVTMMNRSQQQEVRLLAKQAGISPTTTSVSTGHPLLAQIAPGERTYLDGDAARARLPQAGPTAPRSASRGTGGAGRAGAADGGRSGSRTTAGSAAGRGGASRSGASRTGGGQRRSGGAARSSGRSTTTTW